MTCMTQRRESPVCPASFFILLELPDLCSLLVVVVVAVAVAVAVVVVVVVVEVEVDVAF